MTPCENLNYKVGNKFKLKDIPSTDFSKYIIIPEDRIITLYEDDGTNQPIFSGFVPNTTYNLTTQYVKLSDVEKIVDDVVEPVPVTSILEVFKQFVNDLGSGYDTTLFLTKNGYLVNYGLDFDCYEWKGTEAEIIDKINLLRQLHITN